MRYAQIRKMDISNGAGIGVSLFTQGCTIRCKGCHNSELWNPEEGKEFTDNEIDVILNLIRPNHITRFSILGGEPMLKQNGFMLAKLINKIRQEKPQIQIWLYTGYNLHNLLLHADNYQEYILDNIDYLVDGPYDESCRDITLAFRGSRNQKIWKHSNEADVDSWSNVTKNF